MKYKLLAVLFFLLPSAAFAATPTFTWSGGGPDGQTLTDLSASHTASGGSSGGSCAVSGGVEWYLENTDTGQLYWANAGQKTADSSGNRTSGTLYSSFDIHSWFIPVDDGYPTWTNGNYSIKMEYYTAGQYTTFRSAENSGNVSAAQLSAGCDSQTAATFSIADPTYNIGTFMTPGTPYASGGDEYFPVSTDYGVNSGYYVGLYEPSGSDPESAGSDGAYLFSFNDPNNDASFLNDWGSAFVPADNFRYVVINSNNSWVVANGVQDYAALVANGSPLSTGTLFASAPPSPPENGVQMMIDNANAGFLAATDPTIQTFTSGMGDFFLKPWLGSGLALLYELRYWILALVIIQLIVFFGFRAFAFFRR